MAGYNFEIEYVCGLDNKVADALSHMGGRLDEDAIQELLDQNAIKELLSHTHVLWRATSRVRRPQGDPGA